MTREFIIEYITDNCDDCPECDKCNNCTSDSHCFEVKQKIISDLRKMDKIEKIANDCFGKGIATTLISIIKVLEQE